MPFIVMLTHAVYNLVRHFYLNNVKFFMYHKMASTISTMINTENHKSA